MRLQLLGLALLFAGCGGVVGDDASAGANFGVLPPIHIPRGVSLSIDGINPGTPLEQRRAERSEVERIGRLEKKHDELKADVKEKQKQLDHLKEELEQQQKEYEAKKSVLSPTARDQMEKDLQQKAMKAQNTYMELQQELARKEQEALGNLLQKLEPVVQEIATAEGYTYVFEKNEAGLFYAPSAHDLTAQLIRKYNQRFPSKGKSKSDK